MFCKQGVSAGLRPAILLKKRLWHRCFPVNFANFLRTPFLTEHLWWLPLHKFVFTIENANAVFRQSDLFLTLHKNWSFPLRISSVNVAKIHSVLHLQKEYLTIHSEKNCVLLNSFSTRIRWNRNLAASDVFHVYTNN